MKKVVMAAILAALVLMISVPVAGAKIMMDGTEVQPMEKAVPSLAEKPADPADDPSAVDRKEFCVTANNLNALGEQGIEAKTPEDIQEVACGVEKETNITNNYLTERKIIRQRLTTGQLLVLLRKLGYWGGATWGRSEVDLALRSRILRGRADGTTANSSEWKTWVTREELAVSLMRSVKASNDYADAAIETHNGSLVAHSAIQENLRKEIVSQSLWGKIAFWALIAIVVISLLSWLLWRRSNAPAPAPAPFATPTPVGPVAGGGAPATPFVPVASFVTGAGRRLTY